MLLVLVKTKWNQRGDLCQ